MNGISSQGMVFIHAAPRALLPHLEWAIGRILGGHRGVSWQHLRDNLFHAELGWTGDEFTGSDLVSELLGWGSALFEITQDPSGLSDGLRWSYTPKLGLFQTQIDSAGNILVNEFQLKLALEESGSNAFELQRRMRLLLGAPWDEELENFRAAGELAPVIWLRSVAN